MNHIDRTRDTVKCEEMQLYSYRLYIQDMEQEKFECIEFHVAIL